MGKDRLTPFERLESPSSTVLDGPKVDSVDALIQQRKKTQRMLRKNKWLKRLGVFILTFTLAFLSYFYFVSPMSTLNRIEISGNIILGKKELISILKIDVNDPVYALDLIHLNTMLNQIDLVDQGKITLESNNTIHIELTEKRGVALIILENGMILLTDRGEFIEMTAARLLLNLDLPLVVGMSDSTEISALAQILSTLNDEILVNISEIHKEKNAFNEAQMRLMMQEGNQVFAPLSALSALDKYLQVVKITNEKNSCFYIADISFSLVKAECPTH